MNFKINNEKIYILKRKFKAFLHSFIYYLFYIFPIKKNKIVMWTFEGAGGYGCSPMYIAEEILKRNKQGITNFEIVWLVNDLSKNFPPEIKKVKSTLWSRAYHLSTARFWVSNTRTFYGTVKRKATTYLQTWHGTVSLKPIGKMRGQKFSKIAYLVSAADSKLIDYALAGSHWCKETWPEGLVYDGEILLTGTPRCDVLINSVVDKHIQLREEYNIPHDAKILLYAPTFRGGSQNTVRSVNTKAVSVDFKRVIKAFETKFGDQWYVFLRLHPQLAAKMEKMPIDENSDRLIDVSQRPDMCEIMASTDAMITDYSSAIFEGFLTRQPGFLYVDDLDEYIADRGTLAFAFDETPFSIARNNDELIDNILKFDRDDYEKKVDLFVKKFGIIEDGQASKRVVDIIEKIFSRGL